MCLITFAYEEHARYPFIFAANRDERHERPTEQAHFWEDEPLVLAGRDKVAGGTWCGVSRDGRFAALSNYRDPEGYDSDARSRGELVADFLSRKHHVEGYIDTVVEKSERYNGFNLILGDLSRPSIWYVSNRGGAPRELAPGIYGLSNDLLDTPWPKVTRSKHHLAELLNRRGEVPPDELFEILRSEERPPDDELPDTGVDLKTERLVSAPFIVNSTYGTRSSTLIYLDNEDTVRFLERTFDPAGEVDDDVEYAFRKQ